ncbi:MULTISPECIES: helix-turn-helix domain-containing protein [unclassified Actinomyces]|uniref:helix-turn-helix domain-containing protein n=1 Tax=unclassified Actinomyces TaxID=2609248 RepID=UPI0013742BFD|nr:MULTISPECIES: helix-turn-helix domain-containing protein [unclassified Actinomyces]MBW3068887.1 helix-turn-helix domain-containing protein [Actinomyces sp. 594]NDR52563.1 helix-turn-helix domain-containing protein [Actinomyces sp. 565]QHO91433.1 DNA-binding protein [Actinomyces sp. 432]
MPESFLTIAEVAEHLQLSAQGVRALIQSGELPAIQVGARHLWRVPESAFDEYVERQLAATRAMVAAGSLRATRGADA